MPARTGQQYIEGLRQSPPSLYMNGKKVKDPTKQPGLEGGIRTMARLYDLQYDPAIGKEMTYESPATGDQVGISFLTPKLKPRWNLHLRGDEDWLRRHSEALPPVPGGWSGAADDFLHMRISPWY